MPDSAVADYRQPDPAHPCDTGADLLHPHQQREADEQRPAECVPELRADLRVGADAAWIVVAGAGDETGTQTQRGAVPVPHSPRSFVRSATGSRIAGPNTKPSVLTPMPGAGRCPGNTHAVPSCP